MKSLKFYIISQYFLPDVNGDVIRLLNSIKVLKKFNLHITLITAFPHYPYGKIPNKYPKKFFIYENWNGIKVIRTTILPLPHKGFINRFLLYMSFTISSSIAIILKGKADVVWAFSQKIFSYIPALLSKFVYDSRVIVDMTDVWPEAIVNTGYIKDKSILFHFTMYIINMILKISDTITTLTEAMKKMLIARGIKPNKIHVLPNIIMNPAKSSHNRHRAKKFTVMYSGNLGPNYNFKTILLAASKLVNNDICFIIRGRGEMEKFIAHYINVKKLSIVKLDKNLLPKSELIEYLKKADAYILPMKKYPYPDASFPIKLLDYLSLRKPIICLADGYLHELVSKYKIGIAISPSDPSGLINALLLMKNDPKLCKEISENIGKMISYFSPSLLKKSFIQILNQLIKRSF